MLFTQRITSTPRRRYSSLPVMQQNVETTTSCSRILLLQAGRPVTRQGCLRDHNNYVRQRALLVACFPILQPPEQRDIVTTIVIMRSKLLQQATSFRVLRLGSGHVSPLKIRGVHRLLPFLWGSLTTVQCWPSTGQRVSHNFENNIIVNSLPWRLLQFNSLVVSENNTRPCFF